MLKRDDIKRAEKLSIELSNLEERHRYWEGFHAIEVSGKGGVARLELGDYPDPSDLGRAFFAVQKAIVHYYFDQMTLKRAEMTKLGVQL
jgi:hypothetical protein